MTSKAGPTERLRCLVSGLPLSKRKSRRVVTFQAFIDDSGGSLPVFVLSGYISVVDFWEAFSEDWQKELDEPPKLPYFKMREAAKCFGGRMKREDAYHRIKNFVDLVRTDVQASIVSIVPIKNYREIIRGKVLKVMDDPYFIGIFEIVVKLLWNQIAMNSADTLEFVFDDNPKMAAKVPQYYQYVRNHMIDPKYRHLIAAAPKFEDDVEFLPLQAADMQSWYYRRLFEEKISHLSFPECAPKQLFRSLDRIPTLLSLWTSQRCRAWANQQQTPESEDGDIPQLDDIHALLRTVDF